MNVKRSLAPGVALALCLVLGLLLTQQSAGQPPAAANGRYQIAIKPYTQGGNFTTVFVVDTQSGQCWYRETGSETNGWTDMGSPAQKPGR
jgi:hypothetical protein